MKQLNRNEMKNLLGGIHYPHIPGLVGWNLTPQGCLCDFYNVSC